MRRGLARVLPAERGVYAASSLCIRTFATIPLAAFGWRRYLMETLFSTQYLHIYLHRSTHQTLELHWLDFVPSADFRASLLELMRLVRQHRAQALIADNRLLRALRQADLEWSGELVFKGLSELGGRRFAAVESLDAMNRMGITALVANVIPDTQLTSQFFATIAQARAWATAPF